MTHGQSRAARNISNEDLTELALNSAIALDRRLQAQQADQNVIDDFLDVLERLVNVNRDQVTRMLVSDPRKVGVVNRAFRYLNRDTPPTIQALIASIYHNTTCLNIPASTKVIIPYTGTKKNPQMEIPSRDNRPDAVWYTTSRIDLSRFS